MIRIDGNVYTWMGGLPGTMTANQTAYEYTSTKSIFTFHVGDMIELNATFLSPITPDDLRRQSLIFSYLDVDIASLDGKSHDVQLYADISAGMSVCATHNKRALRFHVGTIPETCV